MILLAETVYEAQESVQAYYTATKEAEKLADERRQQCDEDEDESGVINTKKIESPPEDDNSQAILP